MSDMIARGLANKNKSDLTIRKLIVPTRLIPAPPVMVTPPTVTYGVGNAASSITNNVIVPVITTGTTVNPLFRFNTEVKRADWDGTIYENTFPDTLCVRNAAVTINIGYGNMIVEFCVDGSQFELHEKGTGPSTRISVDEGNGYQYVTASPISDNTDGNFHFRLVDFAGVRKLRRIKVEYSSLLFRGLSIGPNDTVFPATRPLGAKTIVFGDSFTGATGATAECTGFAAQCVNMFGWEPMISGVGGTGYINPGTNTTFINRVQHDIISYNPDVVIIQGGQNDTGSSKAAVQAAATLLYQTVQAGLPKAKIFVLGNIAISGISAAITDTRDAIKAACATCKIPFIDSIDGVTYDSNGVALKAAVGNWFTGTGNIGSVQTTGNRSYYTWTDSGHPSQAGHTYIGNRLATEIFSLLNQ